MQASSKRSLNIGGPFVVGAWWGLRIPRGRKSQPPSPLSIYSYGYRHSKDVHASVKKRSLNTIGLFVAGAWLESRTPRGRFRPESPIRIHRYGCKQIKRSHTRIVLFQGPCRNQRPREARGAGCHRRVRHGGHPRGDDHGRHQAHGRGHRKGDRHLPGAQIPMYM